MQPESAAELPDGARRWRWGLIAALLIAGYLALVAVDALDDGMVSRDTHRIAEGSRYALDCMADGDFVACGTHLDGNATYVRQYPLLQYLPTAVLVTLMADDADVVDALARLSFLAYIGILILLVVAGRRLEGRYWASLLPLVALVAPLPFYATTGLGEMLAAFVVLAAVTASLYRWPWLTFMLVVAASLSKETAAPFIAIFALLAALGPEDRLLPPRRMLVAVLSGAGVGLAMTALFNMFRFGAPRNMAYLDPGFRTEGFLRVVEWFVAQLVSPVGGLLWFWLPAFLVSAVVLAIGVRRLHRNAADVAAWGPPLLAVAALSAFLFGLALWFTPFRWITWGPRLVVPMIPGVAVVLVKVGGRELRSMTERVLGSWRGIAVAGVVCVVFAWPHWGAPWTWPQGIEAMAEPCPGLGDDRAGFFACASRVTWKLSPIRAVSGGSEPTVLLARILAGGAILALLVASHELVRERARPERDPVPADPSPGGDEPGPDAAGGDRESPAHAREGGEVAEAGSRVWS